MGFVVIGSLDMMGASIRTQGVCSDLAKGPVLAEAMLLEVMSMPYYDPDDGSGANRTNTGESSSTRQQFDDIGDYDDWSTTTVQDRFGNPVAGYEGWSRSVTVHWADRLNGNIWLLYDTGLKRIMVTVTAPDGTVTKRFGLRSKDGALEQAPTVDKTVLTQIQATLVVGTPGCTAHSNTNLVNHVEDPN